LEKTGGVPPCCRGQVKGLHDARIRRRKLVPAKRRRKKKREGRRSACDYALVRPHEQRRHSSGQKRYRNTGGSRSKFRNKDAQCRGRVKKKGRSWGETMPGRKSEEKRGEKKKSRKDNGMSNVSYNKGGEGWGEGREA